MILPPSNLPGEAADWGRAVQSRTQGVQSSVSEVSSTARNNERFTGGQLAVQANQIQEQVDRSTILVTLADLSVSGNATAEPYPRATRSISVPNPGGSRVAQVEIYAEHDNPNSNAATAYSYLSYEGKIISKLVWRQLTDDVFLNFTTSYPEEGFGMAYVTLPDSGPAEFELTLIRVGFTSTVTTQTLSNIRLYVTPYQKT